MKFTKTYEDAAVKYYDSQDGYYRIIERKSGCTVKEMGNLFNIMGTVVAKTNTLDEALKLFT